MVEPTSGGTESLPINEVLGEIVANVRESRPVVVKAPPGAGKTTGVPPALIGVDVVGAGEILIVQPRRLAARAAAHRLAGLLGEPVSRTAGYHVRFDRKSSHATRLLSMTPRTRTGSSPRANRERSCWQRTWRKRR